MGIDVKKCWHSNDMDSMKSINNLVCKLRYVVGLNYIEMFNWFNKHIESLTLADFDDKMQDLDRWAY